MFVLGDVDKPELNEELLMHYGIRGMKWGFRKGKSVTGVSRTRGMMLDRNARDTKMFKDASAGKGHRLPRASVAVGRKLLGKERYDRQLKKRISEMNKQSKRLKAGKLTVSDRIDMGVHLYRFSGVGLLVSHTPKK